MSHILIERQHTLGLPAARKHAQNLAKKASTQFGVQYRYEEGEQLDVLHFEGSGVEGQLHVSGQLFKLEAQLGFLVAMFQEKIEAKLHAKFDAIVASA